MQVREETPEVQTRMHWAKRLVAVVFVLGVVLAACGDDGTTSGGEAGPLVVATTSVWADVVANLACDGATRVESLMPTGADPHGYEASLADRDRLEQADLVVANGLGLEGGLEDTLSDVEQSGTAVFRVAEHVGTIPLSAAAQDHEDDDHEGDDPHVWFDPQRVRDALAPLAAALVEEAGLDEAAVHTCEREYASELEALDAEVEQILAAVPEENRLLVTSHDSLGYFADRYGFDILGTVIPGGTTLAETNPGALSELAAEIERTGVPAVYTDAQHSDAEARALADEVGAEVITLDTGSLGEPGSESDTYVGLIRTTAQRIADGLTG